MKGVFPTNGQPRAGRLGEDRAGPEFGSAAQVFEFVARSVMVYSDSGWARCKKTCRSTTGGVIHDVRDRQALALYAEGGRRRSPSARQGSPYAPNRASAEALGAQSFASDFGVELRIVLHTDAFAAIGIARRPGAGKLKHIGVQEMWLQGVVRGGRAELREV